MEPKDQSRWARNERLYSHLMQLGLVVEPIRSSVRKDGIEFMLVSTDQIDMKSSASPVTLGDVVVPV